jgi:GntR family transcriptional repressor for pyruvate dehydrogenase complex
VTRASSAPPSFGQLRRDRVSDQVVGQLQQAILRGTFRAGQRIPGEYELATRFSTSRGSIREALRTMETMGLVQIRSGAGAFVTRPVLDPEALSAKLRWLVDRREMVLKMLDVREVLQGLGARLCAGRLTEPQVRALQETLRAMRVACDKSDLDTATDADARFHFLVGEYCGNEFLGDLIHHVEQTYRSSSRAMMDFRGRTATSIEQHGAVVEAFVRRDAAAAEAAMRAHLSSVRQTLAGLTGPAALPGPARGHSTRAPAPVPRPAAGRGPAIVGRETQRSGSGKKTRGTAQRAARPNGGRP